MVFKVGDFVVRLGSRPGIARRVIGVNPLTIELHTGIIHEITRPEAYVLADEDDINKYYAMLDDANNHSIPKTVPVSTRLQIRTLERLKEIADRSNTTVSQLLAEQAIRIVSESGTLVSQL